MSRGRASRKTTTASTRTKRFCTPLLAALSFSACGAAGDPVSTTPGDSIVVHPAAHDSVWDVTVRGYPRIIVSDYIELSKITRISLFRSSQGHDYHDSFESCLSMKHYFVPVSNAVAPTIEIRAPFNGHVSRVFDEFAGTQVQIQSDSIPAFVAIIFHVNLSAPLSLGSTVTGHQLLGHHIGSQTWSDIAIGVNDPHGYRLVSYFDLISDDILATYIARGVGGRIQMQLTPAARGADPLSCSGETFGTPGTLPQWAELH